MERVFDAPRQLVWNAWTQKELLEKWWGPKEWTTTVKTYELVPGGTWLYMMEGFMPGAAEKIQAWSVAKFIEIVEPEKIVYRDSFSDENGVVNESMPSMQVTVTFSEEDGSTKMTSVTKFDKLEDLEKVVAMGVEEGFNMQLDKLAEMLG